MTSAQKATPTTYSCRAECWCDVQGVLNAFSASGLPYQVVACRVDDPHEWLPGYELEIRTTAGRGTILALMRTIDDTHVMRETLRACPLAENSLEREREEATA